MKNKNPKHTIIYIAPALSSFVKNDIIILSKKYNVIENIYSWNKKIFVPILMIRQILFILRYLYSTKLIIISSGGYWSLIPSIIGRIFRKKVFIILNGSDCAAIPSISFGILRKFPLKTVCKISYRTASYLLPVSSSLVHIKNTYFSDDKYMFQGYKSFYPKLKTKYKVIHNGIDETFWKKDSKFEKEKRSFISVFSGNAQFILKGGDLILKISKKFPDCTFYIVGIENPEKTGDISKNIIFIGKLSAESLKNYYSKCQYYLQLSIFEGFGVALCEAMLCECIPIGSSVNVIPDIIGNTGYILQKRDVDMLEQLIKEALSANDKNKSGKNAREQIINNYSFEKRQQELFFSLEQH